MVPRGPDDMHGAAAARLSHAAAGSASA